MMEPQWLAFGKRLQAIASSGLHFAHDQFDRERYEEVASIANAMLASLGNVSIERIEGLVSDFARGYATPKVDVRGALIEGDAILLVQEQSDGLWTLPGGYADVGLSPAQNIEKEVFEEAGLRVSARRLYGVRHKASAGYTPDVRDFYKMFFLCERIDHAEAAPGFETLEARFFPMSELPPLSKGRTIASDIEAAFAFSSDPKRPVYFD
jgi:ADP-ribose pyrophosphatase YjhB (NUDIX family)